MYVPKLRRLPPLEWGTSGDPPGASKNDPDNLAFQPALSTVSSISAARARMLVVDDDDLVRETFCTILQDEGYDVTTAVSGQEALEILSASDFDIMLCDIFMPEQSGMDLLHQATALYPAMPVVLITGYGTVEMAREAVRQGASDFVTKPCNQGELAIIVERNLARRVVQQKNAMRYHVALETSHENVLDAMLTALNTRDTETQGHSERVTAYTMELADHIGIPGPELYHIERGALLHDIGKIGVPDRILHKPSKLTESEWLEMRRHPVIGYKMCVKINMLKHASQIVLHHHEAWDGSGYPDGQFGHSIPLGARIFAIADTLDAMTSDRPYRAALSFSVAREEILRYSGKQFDPEVVEVFMRIPEERWTSIRAQAIR